MHAPQSHDEIRPIVLALQQIDSLLDIRWNPQRIVVRKGRYDERGRLIPPIYDGRWEVIRYETASNLHPERPFTVICTVTEPERIGGILVMQSARDGGKYAPIGEWLLEVMRSADAANVARFREIRDRLWAENDRIEAERDKLDEGAAIAAMDHQHFLQNYTGGVGNWQGKGADFTAMAKAAVTREAARSILLAR